VIDAHHRTIGILALQGDFKEHARKFEQLGCTSVEVRRASQLNNIDALVLPGGESTTIAILESAEADFDKDHKEGIFDAIKRKIGEGLPAWGTCMGSILLAKEIEGSTQGRLAVMDITIRRNAFGAQRWSAERSITIPTLGETPFPAIFIRAPIITQVGRSVQVLSSSDEGIYMAREKNLLATVFHPEVVDDTRVHTFFIQMVA
jgi:5'-phosphate synthase pdxT subunit